MRIPSIWRICICLLAVALLLCLPLAGNTDASARCLVLAIAPVSVALAFIWRRFVKPRGRWMSFNIAAIGLIIGALFALPLWFVVDKYCFPTIAILQDVCACGRERRYVMFENSGGGLFLYWRGGTAYQLKILASGESGHIHEFYDPDGEGEYRITLLNAAMLGPPFVVHPSAGPVRLTSPN